MAIPAGIDNPAAIRANDPVELAGDVGVVLEPARARVARDAAALLVGSPGQVLARIVPGDPLAVRDAVASVLREECVFLDADRVHLRALARIARSALRFTAARTSTAARGVAAGRGVAAARGVGRPEPQLEAWIRTEVAASVAELLREAVEMPRADPGSAFAQFARPLGLDPEAVRRGCAAFNRLPRADRAAFHALVVRDVGIENLARETGETPSELGRRARRGLDAVLHANHPELPPPVRAPASAPRKAGVFPTTHSLPTPPANPNSKRRETSR